MKSVEVTIKVDLVGEKEVDLFTLEFHLMKAMKEFKEKGYATNYTLKR